MTKSTELRLSFTTLTATHSGPFEQRLQTPSTGIADSHAASLFLFVATFANLFLLLRDFLPYLLQPSRCLLAGLLEIKIDATCGDKQFCPRRIQLTACRDIRRIGRDE
ncbi:MAG: hypothetical protein ACPGQV_13455 [Alphaproteobacteria bacterium]